MFQFSTITLLNSLTDKSGQSLFNKEDGTLLFKGEGLYQVDEDHLIEMFKNEGHKEYRDIVDITNLAEMISDPTKIYRIEFYIESNANADPLFSNYLSKKSKTVFVEFNSIDSFYVNLNRFQTMTYGSQLLNLVGELDGEIADGKSTVTSANKTNQNNYLMASNCYIRVMNADVQQADDNGKFYSIGKLDIYHGSEGLGTQEDILKNYILPTGYNNRLSQILTTDQPLNGTLYDQFIIRYFVNRGNLGVHAVGQQTITETLHCFWINQNESQEFEQTINNLIESGKKEKEPPTFIGLYVDDNNNLNIMNYKLGDPVIVNPNNGTQPVYLLVTDEEKNKFTNLYITNEYDEETTADLTTIFQEIDENIAHDFNEDGLENAEQYIGLNLCTIPTIAYGIYSNHAKSAKYTYDGVEYDLTYEIPEYKVTATFNVTSESEEVQLYAYNPYYDEYSEYPMIIGSEIFKEIIIDGESVNVESIDSNNGYNWFDKGAHIVEYLFYKNIIQGGIFNNVQFTSVLINNNISEIAVDSFSSCPNLISIIVDSGNQVFDSRDNCNAIIETNTNTLIQGCSTTTIPDSVISIGNSAFKNCTGLTSINITNDVTSIGNDAFYNCSNLTNISIPDSVTNIGSSAFYNCTAMTTCSIGNDSLLTSIGNSAFYHCSSLTNINIPSGVTSIGDYTFYYCTSLTSVTIPDSVTSIGHGAFYYCTAMTTCTIGNDSLLTNIGSQAFYHCSNLTSINIPSGVTSINENAFEGCTAMTACTIGNDSLLTNIGIGVFSDCRNLTSIIIPESVTYIGNGAFYDCRSLTNINIPSGVTIINQSTFGGCRNLTSITIPSGVTTIDGYAFQDCSGLTSVTCNPSTPPTLSYDVFNNTNSCPIYVPSESVSTYKATTNWRTYASRIQAIQ